MTDRRHTIFEDCLPECLNSLKRNPKLQPSTDLLQVNALIAAILTLSEDLHLTGLEIITALNRIADELAKSNAKK